VWLRGSASIAYAPLPLQHEAVRITDGACCSEGSYERELDAELTARIVAELERGAAPG